MATSTMGSASAMKSAAAAEGRTKRACRVECMIERSAPIPIDRIVEEAVASAVKEPCE